MLVIILLCRDPSEEKIVENFLEEEGIEENKKQKILAIIKGMGWYLLCFNLLAIFDITCTSDISAFKALRL